jgi:hypothetical protein
MPGAITAAQTDNGDDTWDADDTIQLVGEDSYIRFPPTCPSGGIYSLQEADPDADPPVFPVACDLSDRSANDVNEQFWHVYPGETAVVVAP